MSAREASGIIAQANNKRRSEIRKRKSTIELLKREILSRVNEILRLERMNRNEN